MRKRVISNRRIFPIEELDGFYVGNGLCVHITFEDDERIAIDVFDRERAAFGSDAADVVATPIILNLRTGIAELEKASGGTC